jgi:hypothetical protein
VFAQPQQKVLNLSQERFKAPFHSQKLLVLIFLLQAFQMVFEPQHLRSALDKLRALRLPKDINFRLLGITVLCHEESPDLSHPNQYLNSPDSWSQYLVA